jgi:hypothetical protein
MLRALRTPHAGSGTNQPKKAQPNSRTTFKPHPKANRQVFADYHLTN